MYKYLDLYEADDNKVTMKLSSQDAMDYYDYDGATNTEGENGLVDRLQAVLGNDFKCSLTSTSLDEETTPVYLTIERIKPNNAE